MFFLLCYSVSSLSLHCEPITLFFQESTDRQTDGLLIEMPTITHWRQRTRPPTSNYTLKSRWVSCFLSCGVCGKHEWKSVRWRHQLMDSRRRESTSAENLDELGRWMEEGVIVEVELARQRRLLRDLCLNFVWWRRCVLPWAGNWCLLSFSIFET